jgi:hypothetical protein
MDHLLSLLMPVWNSMLPTTWLMALVLVISFWRIKKVLL